MLFWRRRSEQRALSELNLELGSEEGIAQVLRWQAAHARRRRSVQLDSLEQRREGGQGQVQRQHRGLAGRRKGGGLGNPQTAWGRGGRGKKGGCDPIRLEGVYVEPCVITDCEEGHVNTTKISLISPSKCIALSASSPYRHPR